MKVHMVEVIRALNGFIIQVYDVERNAENPSVIFVAGDIDDAIKVLKTQFEREA
jgi:hypothetical protein